jgi:hypothetical protein
MPSPLTKPTLQLALDSWKSKLKTICTDAQVGPVVSVVLTDEELGAATLGRIAEPLLARTTRNAADIAALTSKSISGPLI